MSPRALEIARSPETVASDSRADKRLFLIALCFVGMIFAVGVTAQSMIVLGIGPLSFGDGTVKPGIEAVIRTSINLTSVVIMAVLSVLTKLYVRGPIVFFTLGAAIAIVAGVFRGGLQLVVGVHQSLRSATGDGSITLIVAFMVICIAQVLVVLNRRARSAERARQRASVRATEALTSLQQEELRVRREVADALHGTMQQRLVLLSAELDSLTATLATLPERDAADLETRIRHVQSELDSMREQELRALSAALYPEALHRGVAPAVRALTSRIAAAIAVRFVAEGFPTPDGLNQTSRLLLVRIVEEGISNALRHGKAEEITIKLSSSESVSTGTDTDTDTDVSGDALESGSDELSDGVEARLGEELPVDMPWYQVSVSHVGLPPSEPISLSGLARLKHRVTDLGGDLHFEPQPNGALLSAWLPEP